MACLGKAELPAFELPTCLSGSKFYFVRCATSGDSADGLILTKYFWEKYSYCFQLRALSVGTQWKALAKTLVLTEAVPFQRLENSRESGSEARKLAAEPQSYRFRFLFDGRKFASGVVESCGRNRPSCFWKSWLPRR